MILSVGIVNKKKWQTLLLPIFDGVEGGGWRVFEWQEKRGEASKAVYQQVAAA